MRQKFALLAALVGLLIPMATRAIPTGLNVMPTAEVLGTAQVRVDYETDGSGKLFANGGSIFGTQSGLLLGLEAGVDHVSGEVYNAKWRFKGEGLVTPALAVGVQNIRSGEKIQPYVVATKTLLPGKLAQVHAGVLRDSNDDTLVMLGANGRLGPIIVKVDRIQGGDLDRTAASVGFNLSNITVTGTAYDVENAPDEQTITVSYYYGAF